MENIKNILDNIKIIIEIIPFVFLLIVSINKFQINNILSKYSKTVLNESKFELFFLVRKFIVLSIIVFMISYIFNISKLTYIGELIRELINNYGDFILIIIKYSIVIFCIIIPGSIENVINRFLSKLHGRENKSKSEFIIISIFEKLLIGIFAIIVFIYSENFFSINIYKEELLIDKYMYLPWLVLSVVLLIYIKDFKKIEEAVNIKNHYIITVDNNTVYNCSILLELKNDYLLIQDDNEIYINKAFVKTIRKIRK